MSEEQEEQEQLLDTTDCLEAIGAFKAMKNFLFVIVVICLLLLQASFWVVDLNYVRIDKCGGGKEISSAYIKSGPFLELAVQADTASAAQSGQGQITSAARQVTKDLPGQGELTGPEQLPTAAPIKSAEPETPTRTTRSFRIDFKYVAWLVRFCNFVLIIVAVLYCLILVFSLKISLAGRLGGINHISRAFFLSLFMLVFLLPWQKLFDDVIVGAVFTPGELLEAWCGKAQRSNIILQTVYYCRFVVLWLVVLLLAICAQARTIRWAKASLRRLEIL
jgi:hypothetical protein